MFGTQMLELRILQNELYVVQWLSGNDMLFSTRQAQCGPQRCDTNPPCERSASRVGRDFGRSIRLCHQEPLPELLCNVVFECRLSRHAGDRPPYVPRVVALEMGDGCRIANG